MNEKQKVEWERKAMSEWLHENAGNGRVPADDGWEFNGGALRRPKSSVNDGDVQGLTKRS